MDGNRSLKLSDAEIAASFLNTDRASQFPSIQTIEQAAAMLQYPVETFRNWRSRGLLCGCSRRVGKRVRFYRDRLLKLFIWFVRRISG
jgi:hypothetical protein